MRRLFVLAAAVSAVTLAAVGGLAPMVSAGSASAGAPAPYCGITWGSLAKSKADLSTRPITNVRAGQHACYDRLVVDLGAPPAGVPAGRIGYAVHYGTVSGQGTGTPIPLAGGADLEIVVHAPTYDVVTGRSTYNPADHRHLVDVAGFRTFRQVADGGSFEGYTTIGLGVRARLPFRVFVLSGPGTGARLVIDVAHRWQQ
jgi:hypothetical protein